MSTFIHRSAWCFSTAALALLAVGPSAAQVQTVQAEQAQRNAAIEEIVVTARKRAENLQSVPLSIQAFSETELRRGMTLNLDDLAESTLGLSFTDVNGAYQNPAIRGLAQTNQLGLEGNVGVFIDGVYLDNRSGLEFGNMELERIEVVKGPQSALYGRNTFAGAINYVTKAPNLQEFEGLLEGTLGNRDRWTVRGALNAPIVRDKLAVRVFGGAGEFGGTVKNLRDGSRKGGYRDRDTIGAQVLFQPIEPLTLRVFATRNKRDDEQPATVVFGYDRINNCGAAFNLNPVRGAPPILFKSLYCGGRPDVDTVNLDPRGRGNSGTVDLIYGTLSYEFTAFTATFQASHTKSDFSTFVDQAGDPTAFTRVLSGNFSQQFFTDSASDVGESDSYELRLQSNGESAWRWLVGGSYYDTLGGTALASRATPVGQLEPLQPLTRVERRLETKEKAAFGSLGYEFGRFTATAELRYTDVDQVFNGQTIILFLPLPPTIVPRNEQSFSAWTPRFIADYRITDDFMVYATVGRGWKQGGFNPQNAPFDRYEPEANWSYEIGFKSTWWDDRVVLNGAAYYIDWSNLQINQTINALGSTAITNIGGATSKGFELETQIALTENLSLRAGITLLDPQFKNGTQDASLFTICGLRPDSGIVGAPCSIDVSGKRVARVSSRQAFLGATYTMPELIAGFDAYVRADFSHQNGKYAENLNFGSSGSINLTNLRLGLTNDAFEFAFWINNLFDETYARSQLVATSPSANNFCIPRGQNCSLYETRVYLGDRRTFGITGTYRF
jgi:iron complex outermembrane receptor protein